MTENSKIEWTDHTFNPWLGCTKVGAGCDHCYAEGTVSRFKMGAEWGPGQPRKRTSDTYWEQPRKWQRAAAAFDREHNRRQRVFCASLADVFDNEVSDMWRGDLFALIDDTPDLDWLLVTKRVGNVEKQLQAIGMSQLPENVWLGITVVDQDEANRDIPKLLALPATCRFLSIEPMLGPVNLDRLNLGHRGWYDALNGRAHHGPAVLCDEQRVDWVIAGGESGPHARPPHPDWFRALRDQCDEARVPFLFKQWGEYGQWSDEWPQDKCLEVNVDGSVPASRESNQVGSAAMIRLGKSHAGRTLDGIQHTMFPQI